ncbi:hypothetical protein BCD48_24450 [Pseudofrankia sp. BMG5.36]|nr:hypothetical protein BCD48_24450 [Pseudofrankia sp. BMG5.36]
MIAGSCGTDLTSRLPRPTATGTATGARPDGRRDRWFIANPPVKVMLIGYRFPQPVAYRRSTADGSTAQSARPAGT